MKSYHEAFKIGMENRTVRRIVHESTQNAYFVAKCEVLQAAANVGSGDQQKVPERD
jgi:hypothetical protein